MNDLKLPPELEVNPRLQVFFEKLGKALTGEGSYIDAQNELQDIIDERKDLERGPGG